MSKPWIRSAALVFAFALAGAACATTAQEDTTTGEPAAGQYGVQVENDLIPPTSLTVWLVPETGARVLLGTVQPSETTTFTLEQAPAAAVEYRLLARTTDGTEVTSNPFTMSEPHTVTWNTQSNLIRH